MSGLSFLYNHLGDIASFLTSTGMIYLFICKAMKRLQPYTDLTDHVDSINSEIKDIKKELTNNSGTSLKDLVSNIRVDVKSNTELTTTILNRQRWMLDNRSEPIFETNKEGKFTWVNDSFIRLTDRGFKDLKDNNWINILHEDVRSDVTKDWYLALQTARNFEHTVKITDGKNNCFQAKIIAHRQEDGNYIGTLNNIVKNN
jgi:PAS domain-containing protein